MYCAKCGKPVRPNSKYCRHCGTKAKVTRPAVRSQELSVTFLEGETVLAEHSFSTGVDTQLRFGSDKGNDIVVNSPSHSMPSHCGAIQVRGGQLYATTQESSEALYSNGAPSHAVRLSVGDVVSLGMPQPGKNRTVIVVGLQGKRWNMLNLTSRTDLTIGRAADNDLRLDNPTVANHHAYLERDPRGGWKISDMGSPTGTRVDGTFVTRTRRLPVGALLTLGNAQIVYLDSCLLVMVERRGVEVVAQGLVRYRTNQGVRRITTDHISIKFGRGEFVAIVGGSGCGKSTLLNELNGSEPADEGNVTLDGIDLYANFDMLKSSIGYVPQQDIVYDDLRLEDMLLYASKLRMQPDSTLSERTARVNEVIDLLELGGVRGNLIGKLSGGQKKRASIAVELLADPRLLFLDEPTSGLDPGIERKLMLRLAEMAHEGRTIILVTHTTLNLHLCDKVVFLGSGGKLCYEGNPQGALPFFDVDDYVEVYPKIEEKPEYWERRFATTSRLRPKENAAVGERTEISGAKRTPGFFSQLATLSLRYAKLMISDTGRFALMLGQAPLLAILIYIVAGKGVFDVCEDTKFCLFAISCAAFWVGVFDSIQEICKETSIFRRECDGGMKLSAYIASKVLVLGTLCLLQTVLLVGVLILTMGLPSKPLFSAPIELILSTYLTVLSAMCLGLLVSALFRNPAAALAVAPLLIMPQILFSGIAFELNGITENISYAINCRWAIEALGTTANLNDLDLKIYGEEITVPPEHRTLENQTIDVPSTTVEVDVGAPVGKKKVEVPAEKRKFEKLEVDVPKVTKTVDSDMLEHERDSMFEHTMGHLLRSWGILLAFCAIGVIGCYVLLALQIRK